MHIDIAKTFRMLVTLQLFLHSGPDSFQSTADFDRYTHPSVQLFHTVLLSFLFRRSQTESCQSQVAVVEVSPLVARELAETAHDRMLSQRQEI